MFSCISKLPKRQQSAIPALLRHPTTRAAAKDIGVHEVTLIKWMRSDDFQAAYREGRYLVMEEAFSALQKACVEAAETLLDIMRDPEANHFVRLQAANSVLDMAAKSRTIDELEARIAALEHPDTESAAEAA